LIDPLQECCRDDETECPMAMKIAFDNFKDSNYKTRDKSITDVGKYEKDELSLVSCNDECIRKINNESRGEDHVTDMVSMSHHIHVEVFFFY
jgi:ssRNA-specific RNase YbeY (16S rRNA maturation enzyme)